MQPRRTALISSLKWAPGLAKEFRLIGRNLQKRGWQVQYLLSKGYQWQLDASAAECHFLTDSTNLGRTLVDSFLRLPWIGRRLRELLRSNPPHFILLYNSHPLDPLLLLLARQTNPAGIRALFLHEPYKPKKLSFGLFGAALYTFVELLQAVALRLATVVIVPSDYAKQLFLAKYSSPSEIHVAPLMIPDIPAPSSGPSRRFVSLIGNLNRDRGLEEFLALIEHAVERKSSWEFQLVTRSAVSRQISSLSPEARTKLTVLNKPHISDDEIAACLSRSFALLLPHKSVTQSGNVPVAFRSGTPIVARDLPGLRQHISHKENGFLLCPRHTTEDLYQAVEYVRLHYVRMSRSALLAYRETFAEDNWPTWYGWLQDTDLQGEISRPAH